MGFDCKKSIKVHFLPLRWQRYAESLFRKIKPPNAFAFGGKAYPAYRYLAVETFTPGPMVDTTVQERIY